MNQLSSVYLLSTQPQKTFDDWVKNNPDKKVESKMLNEGSVTIKYSKADGQ